MKKFLNTNRGVVLRGSGWWQTRFREVRRTGVASSTSNNTTITHYPAEKKSQQLRSESRRSSPLGFNAFLCLRRLVVTKLYAD